MSAKTYRKAETIVNQGVDYIRHTGVPVNQSLHKRVSMAE
jgi:hypothetical protein